MSESDSQEEDIECTSQSLTLKPYQAIIEEANNNQPQKETHEERYLAENSQENKSKDEENVNGVDSDNLGDYSNYLDWESGMCLSASPKVN